MNEIDSLLEKAEQGGFLTALDDFEPEWNKSKEFCFPVPEVVYSAPIEALTIDEPMRNALHQAGFTVVSSLMAYLGEQTNLAGRLHISQDAADKLRGTVIEYCYRCLPNTEKRAFWKNVLMEAERSVQ